MSDFTPTSLASIEDSVVAFVDYQPSIFLTVQSHDVKLVEAQVSELATYTSRFGIPAVLSTAGAERQGPLLPSIVEQFSGQEIIDRSGVNAWEDDNFRSAIEQTGRRKLIMTGLWTEVCVAFTALSAKEDGYEVYAVTDAIGGTSREAHDMAILRMVQAGVVPTTTTAIVSEWFRDWTKEDLAQIVFETSLEHGGGVGELMRFQLALQPPRA